MSSTTLSLRGSLPGKNIVEIIDCGGGGCTIVNYGPVRVYFRDRQPVDAVSFDDYLDVGDTAILTGTQCFTVDQGVTASAVDRATIQITEFGDDGSLTGVAADLAVHEQNTSTAHTINLKAPIADRVWVVATSGAAQTVLDPTVYGTQKFYLSASSCVFTMPNPVAGVGFNFVAVQDATGGRGYTFSGPIMWPDNAQPMPSTGANYRDVIPFYSEDGAAWTALVPSYNPRKVPLTADSAAVNNTVTLADVTGLGFTIDTSATGVWYFRARLLVNAASATMDSKFKFTVPGGATMVWGAVVGTGQSSQAGWGAVGTATTPLALLDQTASATFGTVTGTMGLALEGFVFGGGTAGTVQLQMAQSTAEVANLKLLKGSSLEIERRLP